MNARQRRGALPSAPLQFVLISTFALLVNFLLQYFLGYQSWLPVTKGLLDTFVVAVFVVPLGYRFLLRPLSFAKKTLHDDEMHYRIVSELTTTFVFKLSVAEEGSISLAFLSEGFYSFAGRSDEVRTFSSLLDHIHPEDRSLVLGSLRKVLVAAQPVEIECRAFVGERHEPRWVLLQGRSEWDPDKNRVTSISGALTDITERRQAEDALRESEEKYRVLFNNEVDAICIIDSETFQFLDVNETFTRLCGYGRDELLSGMSIQDIAVENQAPDRMEGRIQRQGTSFVPVRYVRNRDGKAFPVEAVGVPYVWKGRRVVCSILRDITERVLTEEAVKESEAKYRLLFENDIYAIDVYDLETLAILDANGAHVRLYGYTREELLSGMTILDLTAEVSKSAEAISRINDTGSVYIPLRYHRKKDGTSFPVEIASASYVLKGRRIGFGIIRDISERKSAEEQQARVQNLLEVSQRLAHIGSWEYELSSGKLSWSDEMYRIAGLPAGSPISRALVERFFPPDDLFRSRRALSALLQDNSSYSTTYKVVRPDGQSRIIHNEGEMVLDEGGKPVRLFGTTQDITERRLAEEALEEKTRILSSLYENVTETIFYLDVEGEDRYRFQSVNPAFLRSTGLSAGAVIGKLVNEVIPEPSLQLVLLNYRKAIRNRTAVRWEEETLYPAGSRVGDVTVTPVFDGHGTCTNLIGTVYDITERTRSAVALKESEEKFRSIIEQSADGVVVTDENGAIVEWNKAQEAVTGLPRKAVMGLPAWDVEGMLVPVTTDRENRVNEIRTKMQGLLHAGGWKASENVEHPIVTSDGTDKTVSEHVFVISKGAGNMVVSFVTDITNLKTAEEEKVRVEQYLQQAQRLESLGVLAGGIAHDFNNILTGVFGYMELALAEVRGREASENLSQALKSMGRAKALTQQLLTFSRGGAPVKRITPVGPLIKEVCEFASSGSNVKYGVSLPDGLWNCNIDRSQIGQVMQNLMINAIQAMPMGGTILVSARNLTIKELEQPALGVGDYLLISVQDQGVGISPEMLPGSLTRFSRPSPRGTGWGLPSRIRS